jgi:hypothetical protein
LFQILLYFFAQHGFERLEDLYFVVPLEDVCKLGNLLALLAAHQHLQPVDFEFYDVLLPPSLVLPTRALLQQTLQLDSAEFVVAFESGAALLVEQHL